LAPRYDEPQHLVNFKTFRYFPTQSHIKRNLIQNNLQLYSLSPLDIHTINFILGGLLGDLTGIRRSNSPTDSLKVKILGIMLIIIIMFYMIILVLPLLFVKLQEVAQQIVNNIRTYRIS
jgi:hypothetical protein